MGLDQMGLAALENTDVVLLLGAGREGASTYRFLRSRYPNLDIVVADQSAVEKLDMDFVAALNTDARATLITGDDAFSAALRYDLVIKSPGIPPHQPPLVAAQARGTQFISNTQLFFELVPRQNIIAITGTKGKSTTASMIHHVLSQHLADVRLLGNIGVPPLGALESATINEHTHFVIEMSSYQLHNFPYSPHVAVLQNIVPEHLTWHGTFEAYVDAKTNITRHQTPNDWLIFNADGDQSVRVAASTNAQTVGFGLQYGDCTRHHEQLVLEKEAIIAVADIPLRGEFNLLNVMPAIILGRHVGMTAEQIAAAMRVFKPLAHRLEYVATVNGVDYYDDSLATVPEATVAALQGFSPQPIILIAGGHDRGVDYTPLAHGILTAKVRHLILFPTTGDRIAAALHDLAPDQLPTIHHITTMAAAVQMAAGVARAGDVVLMSPASASFNLFRDYADRSRQFKDAIAALE